MNLREYIELNFSSQVDFAQKQGVCKQQVTKWINGGHIVIEDVRYSPRKKINK